MMKKTILQYCFKQIKLFRLYKFLWVSLNISIIEQSHVIFQAPIRVMIALRSKGRVYTYTVYEKAP